MAACIKAYSSAFCYHCRTDPSFRVKLIPLALGIIALIGITIMAAQGRPLLPNFYADVGQCIAFIGIVGILIWQVNIALSLARDVYKHVNRKIENHSS